jgi:hypothetical protein
MEFFRDLSTREKQAYGAWCLYRFCKAKRIEHRSIDELIDHLLSILIESPLDEWERKEGRLELCGRGMPLPKALEAQLPADVRTDFARLVDFVVDIGVGDMYAASSMQPLADLIRILGILDDHGVERPDRAVFFKDRTPRGTDTPDWGDRYSRERYEQVRALFR